MSTRVLVSGASVAGPALAYWLTRYGFEVTIVERAPELRSGGQNVDIRGAGREVSRRMGIEGDIAAATTGEAGVRFVDEHDATIASFAAGTDDSGGPTAELEILRGDLARILVDRTREDVTYLFGDKIVALEDTPDVVEVTFEQGGRQQFDLVVAADGIRSSTRPLIVGDEPRMKPLGLYTSYFTIPRAESDSAWARWFNAPGGRTVTIRPDNVDTTRATLSFMAPSVMARSFNREAQGYERLDTEGQKDVLRERFAGVGWEVPRILAALDEADVYFEAIGQVQAPHWSRGRMALVGDAAYCASPISGMGTSLALTGAYVLAGELGRHRDHRQAFAAYETILRPYVTKAQQLPPGTPRLANPDTRAGIAAFNTVLRIASNQTVSRIAGKLFTPKAEKFTLPDYTGA